MSRSEKVLLTVFAGLIIIYHLARWPVPALLVGVGLIVYAILRVRGHSAANR